MAVESAEPGGTVTTNASSTSSAEGAGAPAASTSPAHRGRTRAARRAEELAASTAAPERAAQKRPPSENSIRPSRLRTKEVLSTPGRERVPVPTETPPPEAPSAAADGEPSVSLAAPSSAPAPRKQGSWAIPDDVRERFVQVGRTYYFPDGARAFEDRGKRLVTTSENTEVIRSLIAIAQLRGWSDVTASGTDRFRREAWRAGALAGLRVRGHRPSESERVQLVRALSGRESAEEPADTVVGREPGRAAPRGSRGRRDVLIVGRLLEHGAAPYRFDSQAKPSYYVRLETEAGERTLWGKDLQRAIAESLTKPTTGDEVALRPVGRDAVTVKAPKRDAEGTVIGEEDLATHRNRWVLEKRSFFEAREQAARTLRDPAADPAHAAQSHPVLVGEYLKLHGAQLIADRHIAHPEDRRRFVDMVRERLAHALGRGEPTSSVRLRERAMSHSPVASSTPIEREQVQVRG